jgi:hypothetical protein
VEENALLPSCTPPCRLAKNQDDPRCEPATNVTGVSDAKRRFSKVFGPMPFVPGEQRGLARLGAKSAVCADRLTISLVRPACE